MIGRKMGLWQRIILAQFVVFITTFVAFGQIDPNPNSPVPMLLTHDESNRALVSVGSERAGSRMTRGSGRIFNWHDKIELYAANLDMMAGEGANALRIYAVDSSGRSIRMPILGIRPYLYRTSYAIELELADESGFWNPPKDVGDIFVYLTWRGLASNKAILSVGRKGPGVKESSDMSPMPIAKARGLTGKRTSGTASPEYVGYLWSGDRNRFLQQATFGPTSALDFRIRRIGIRTWLAEQFEAPYPSLANPYPDQPLKPNNPPSDCDNNQTIPDVPATCFRDTYTMYQPLTWFMREAFYGDAQLRHRVAWALSQIWVTSGVDIQQGRHMVEYHKVLSGNAFGNYRTLMKEMTLNPAMGSYLDMARSTKNNPNENYARELMQLFTVGLFMLNPDGTLMLDAGGSPIPTYDQEVVNNLTKVLTGWTFCNSVALCPNIVAGTVNYIDPLILTNTNNHDLTAKSLLSYPGSTTTNIAACSGCNSGAIATYAADSMEQALDNIFNHPNVGPFVSTRLIQHLVVSDPTPAYVGRIAAVFNDNGLGVRGDMKAVIKAILLDPEARGDVKTDPNYGKLREPVLFATTFARAFGVRSANGTSQSDGFLTGRAEFSNMGQIPFASPTVFNFYPPDYVIPGTTLLGPEFAIMTTGTAIQRANFINRMVFTTVPIPVSIPNAPNGTAFDFRNLVELVTADPTGNRLLDELNQKLLHGTMSLEMRNAILPAITSVSSTDPLGRARQALYLVSTSSQFQVQR